MSSMISINLQAQQALLGTQHLLGPTRLVTRCLGTQIGHVLVWGELIILIAQVSILSFLSLQKS
jgi:hypothetical protein